LKRLLYALPLLLFAVVVGYFLIGLGRDPATLPSALIDKPAPDFALPPLGDGPGLATADLEGRVTLVNFFASWCVPCRSEHPMLMRIGKSAHLVGIAYKDKPEDSRRFLGELGNPYARVAVDRDGRTAIDFGVYGVPETYVVDRSGKIRLRFVGPLTQKAWDEEVAPLVRRLSAAAAR
jgi:cytochrome c biogenesis protein CcmG/thiol:disulfide interchange protein DsbE